MPAHENQATAAAGAKISLTTSSDPQHGVECIIDGNNKTFWTTTGLYPQEIIVTLPRLVAITKVVITSLKVAHWTAEISMNEKPNQFERLAEQDVEEGDQAYQVVTLTLPKTDTTARHLRLTITRGYGPFASVHKLAVYGSEPSPVSLPDAAS